MDLREPYRIPQNSPVEGTAAWDNHASASSTTPDSEVNSNTNGNNTPQRQRIEPKRQNNQNQQYQIPAAPRYIHNMRRNYDTPDGRMWYICRDCGKDNGFRVNEVMRCSGCGGMVMQKPRAKLISQFSTN